MGYPSFLSCPIDGAALPSVSMHFQIVGLLGRRPHTTFGRGERETHEARLPNLAPNVALWAETRRFPGGLCYSRTLCKRWRLFSEDAFGRS